MTRIQTREVSQRTVSALADAGIHPLLARLYAGRGIRNKLEAHLVNPLARALFDQPPTGPVAIARLETGAVTSLVLEPA